MWRSMWSTRVTTVMVLGLLGFVYVTVFLGQSGALDIHMRSGELRSMVLAAAVFLAVEYPRAHWTSRRRFAVAAAWLDRGGSPTLAEARAFGALPRQQAAAVLIEWTIVSAAGTLIHGLTDPSIATLLVLLSAGCIYGLHMAGTVYVLVERSLRPGFRRLSAHGESLETGEPGLGTRLLASWTLCAGVATFGAVLIISWPDEVGTVNVGRALLPLAAFVLIEGGALTALAVRSLSVSLHDLQSALHRVEGGDLDVRLDIDDRTELGALRRSFNSMVTGLRDGAHLQRLLDGQVGPEVARVARTRGVQLAGERQNATVLSVDMIGSTSFAERCDPETFVALLNGYFDLVVRRIVDSGGNVLQFQGDGALCVFGAPRATDDHERLALSAARALRDDLERFRLDGNPGFDAAVAVATGSLVVGHVGNEERFSYTVIGDVVNEACRLTDEAKAHPMRLLATSNTVARGGDEASNWRAAPPLRLRGRESPTAVHSPISTGVGSRVGSRVGHEVGQERDAEPIAGVEQRSTHHGSSAESFSDTVDNMIELSSVVAVQREGELNRVGGREVAHGDADEGAAVRTDVGSSLGE